MARYTGPSCKLCRREKQKLFLKGTKCFTEKCPIERKNYAPGQHGLSRRAKVSDYSIQLREKQKVKRTYGLLESQFRNYFELASRQKGRTGENLVKLLERRLDNIVYRAGLAPSRKAARQLILHKHFKINGKNVNIPSFLLKAGDTVQVKDQSKQVKVFHESMKRVKDDMLPSWLQVDKAGLKGTLLSIPQRIDIPFNANEQLIVELYSK
ncbi:MAG: 30S ribosomal protein S4 [Chlorobi bacterium]|nr:30S ribosomal protein S4 [Chlorobiota bacterium]MCI0714892.1 30S ribosomal protein S4 [Chlorobiota bacterium]